MLLGARLATAAFPVMIFTRCWRVGALLASISADGAETLLA
jgi:hypothetical protein